MYRNQSVLSFQFSEDAKWVGCFHTFVQASYRHKKVNSAIVTHARTHIHTHHTHSHTHTHPHTYHTHWHILSHTHTYTHTHRCVRCKAWNTRTEFASRTWDGLSTPLRQLPKRNFPCWCCAEVQMMRNKKQVLRIAATLHVLSAKQVLLSSYIVLSTCTQVHQSGNFLLCFEVLHNQTIASIVHPCNTASKATTSFVWRKTESPPITHRGSSYSSKLQNPECYQGVLFSFPGSVWLHRQDPSEGHGQLLQGSWVRLPEIQRGFCFFRLLCNLGEKSFRLKMGRENVTAFVGFHVARFTFKSHTPIKASHSA